MDEVNLIIIKKNGEINAVKSTERIEKIITNINDTNFLNSCEADSDMNKQIIKCNIKKSETGIPGCIERNIEYNLTYNESFKCYLY